EVGRAGEVRAISQVEPRIAEIKKMGFTTCLIPASSLKRMNKIDGIKIIGIKTVSQAIEILF
ncbi:MAG: DNA repair protein RadA, partial [Deltaproteobacteria bacterium]|nr:DNA repair protein RadA [Deltaproteobacteria bacterium]